MSATANTDGILDLKGRIGLVTGAGQGVGRETALHFARANAGGVVVNDYYAERAAAVAAEVEALGVAALPAQCDVTSYPSVAEMFARAIERFGRVELLVNNAGNAGADPHSISRKPFWEQEPSDWGAFLDVNLFGVLHCVRAALPGMIERGCGRIVTVISDAGRVGEPNLEIYSGAKAGAAGFTRAIAKSTAHYGITANCVALGVTRTPATVEMTENDEMARRILRHYPLRRFGQPADAAGLILFLASDAASWITGQTYPVNGGYSMAQ
jgi:3-oxoacyl-[acyl-carrier protein] reductase